MTFAQQCGVAILIIMAVCIWTFFLLVVTTGGFPKWWDWMIVIGTPIVVGIGLIILGGK